MTWVDDTEFETSTIEKVDRSGDGWTMLLDSGWSFFCPANDVVVPAPGMAARLYGKGIGHTVRGLVIDGKPVFYRTDAEQQAKDLAEVEADARKRQAEYHTKQEEYERRIKALPAPLQERIRRFEQVNPIFDRDYLAYELFCCEQAVVIATALKTAEAIREFYNLPYEQQREKVPAIDGGHSGNTFGASCLLARYLIDAPQNLYRVHGAMCGLVGCKEYGCWAATQD